MLLISWALCALLTALLLTIIVYHRLQAHKQASEINELAARNKELATMTRRVADNAKQTEHQADWYKAVFRESNSILLTFPIDDDCVPAPIEEVTAMACNALEYGEEELRRLTVLDIEVIDETYLKQAAASKRETTSLENTLHLGRDSSVAARAAQLTFRRVLREGEVNYEGNYIAKGGRRIPVAIRARAMQRGDENLIICTATDLTEKRRAAELLRSSRQWYKDFITNSPLGVVIYDGQKNMVDVNAACLKLFGCPDQAEFAKFNLFDNPYLPLQVQRDIRRGDSFRFELAIDLDRAVKDGLFISSNHGKRHFDLMVTNLGLDKNYNARGYLVQIQNITRRRETEAVLRQRERQLRQAQKLEAIGALAGGIAHDFNNILTPILGYSQLGMDLCNEGEKLHQFLEEILASSRRAKDLVSQILTFSRQTDGTKHPIALTPIIKEVIKQVAAILPDNIKISRKLKTDTDRVIANPTQIHQILMNLCTNAIHTMKDSGGELEVHLSSFILARHHRKEFPQLVTTEYLLNEERRGYLRISVRDTGHGMDAETMERIFEPFFTTKGSGEGTGMGLAVVHGIVISMGGAISVESEVGKGTVFHVVLPTVEQPQEAEETAQPVHTEDSSLCVLFVDDEVGIIKMAGHMLRSLGYEPVVTHESKEALRIFEQQPNRFDVVITDQVMPEMPGSELAEKMLARRPELPIVLCTGFSESLTPAQARSIGIREVLMKPIEKNDLARTIERVIREPAPASLEDGELVDAGQTAEDYSKASMTL